MEGRLQNLDDILFSQDKYNNFQNTKGSSNMNNPRYMMQQEQSRIQGRDLLYQRDRSPDINSSVEGMDESQNRYQQSKS